MSITNGMRCNSKRTTCKDLKKVYCRSQILSKSSKWCKAKLATSKKSRKSSQIDLPQLFSIKQKNHLRSQKWKLQILRIMRLSNQIKIYQDKQQEKLKFLRVNFHWWQTTVSMISPKEMKSFLENSRSCKSILDLSRCLTNSSNSIQNQKRKTRYCHPILRRQLHSKVSKRPMFLEHRIQRFLLFHLWRKRRAWKRIDLNQLSIL